MSQIYSNARKSISGRLMTVMTDCFDAPQEDVLGALADLNAMVPVWLGLPMADGEEAPSQTEKPATTTEEKPRRGRKSATMSPETRDAIAANPLSLPSEVKPETKPEPVTAPAVPPTPETAPAVAPQEPTNPPAETPPEAPPAAPEVPVYDSTNKDHKRELARILQEVCGLDLTQKEHQGFATAVNLAINGLPIPTSIEADLRGKIVATLSGLKPATKAPF